MSEEEKIERLLNSIAKGCDGSIADEVKAIIIKQQKEIEELHKEINRRIKLKLENEKSAEKDFVYKGKIKEKMREIMGYTFTTSEERHCQNYAYDRLKELLEEK